MENRHKVGKDGLTTHDRERMAKRADRAEKLRWENELMCEGTFRTLRLNPEANELHYTFEPSGKINRDGVPKELNARREKVGHFKR